MSWLEAQTAEALQAILLATPDAVLVIGPDGRIRFANDRVVEVFGWEPDQLAGEPLDKLVPASLRADHGAMVRAFFERPRLRAMGSGLIITGIHRNGATLSLDIKLTPVETSDGRVVVAAVRDIRHVKRAEEQLRHQKVALESANEELRRLNEDKARFLGIAAHDLRNPLTAIIGYTDILMLDLQDRVDGREMETLRKVRQTAQFMATLVNDLLDFAAIEAGRLRLDLGPVDLATLATETAGLLEPIAGRKAIRLRADTSPDARPVRGDRVKLEQVLHNLIDNAVKFSRPGTSVDVRVWHRGDATVLTVADEGPGIPSEEQDALFRPFERTSVRATQGEGSTGLGLAIVQRIVEGHGGRIWLESEVGRGSAFHVALPALGDAA